MAMNRPDGYAIRDTETGEWFSTRRNKRVWEEPGHAKNAWNVAQPYSLSSAPKFTEQTRFICLPVKLTPLEIEK